MASLARMEGSPALRNLIEFSVQLLEVAGTLVIVLGVFVSLGALFLRRAERGWAKSYQCYRRYFGRAILLGLEFLVAGDIIRTITEFPSLRNVSVLGLIVVIRTFLSMTLEVEIEGRFPWHQEKPQRSVPD